MVQIDDTLISLDLFEKRFVCDLAKCKGICCVEGDSGAPLEESELVELEAVLPAVWDDLSPKAQSVIRRQGVAYRDTDGDLVTSIVDGLDCVFTYYDEQGYCKCAIEKAYREGKVSFYKPVSCHLYPVRVDQHYDFRAVNYHSWSVCRDAICLGRKLDVPVYRFLKEPLIRKFGKAWYDELEIIAKLLKEQRQ